METRCNVQRIFVFFLCLSVLILLALSPTSTLAQSSQDNEANSSQADSESRRGGAVVGVPIESGWVVLDGKFIDPPYIIGIQERDIFLNGQRVMTTNQNAGGNREGGRRGEGQAEGRGDGIRGEQDRRRRRGGTFNAARIERQLIEGNLVVMATDTDAATISRHRLPKFVQAMASDEPQSQKVVVLNAMVQRPVHSAVWATTIERYEPAPRLDQAVKVVQEEIDQRAREREADEAGIGWFSWIMPMAAIGGVLAGIGVLLQVQRHALKESSSYRVWRHVDTSGRRSKVVFVLIGLLVLLNGLDLTFTLIAQQTGEFAELSPIGDSLISKPILLGLYKVAAVGLGVGLLLYLRRRRAAEVAAWWMCALYVLVLVRWVAVNTLIMS
ncbi:MAG: DUF5658 family protein [Phycisphaeraceae bacterium]